MAKYWMPEFRKLDPDACFVVTRPFDIDGIPQIRGRSFDRSRVTTRLLRQLYERRWIEMVEGDTPAAPDPSLTANLAVFTDRPPVVVKRKRGRPRRDRPQPDGYRPIEA